MVRVWPLTFKPVNKPNFLQDRFDVVGKTRTIAFQLFLRQYGKTSRFAAMLQDKFITSRKVDFRARTRDP